jgi:LysM repeat protein
MRDGCAGKRALFNVILLLIGAVLLAAPAHGQPYAAPQDTQTQGVAFLPAQELSPLFLGMYRKVMEIETEITKYANKYQVDLDLARAVCMYESGGNPGLRSVAGAQGYFQVMPSTFRSLHVRTNIEAGIKYLGQLTHRFGKQDAILAGYNGGPTRVARGWRLPMETKQYVQGVGYYREVLENYGPSVRKYAEQLGIATVQRGEDWWKLSERLNVPLAQLRLYNPFLAGRTLRVGYRVAYPLEPVATEMPLVEDDGGEDVYYRVRLGDNVIKLAGVFGADLGAVREANDLDPLEALPAGAMLKIPLRTPAKFTTYRVALGDDLSSIAQKLKIDPWAIVQDNRLWSQRMEPGTILRIRVQPPPPRYIVYRVRRGDTLSSIAQRYRTTVRAIQQINSMGRRTRILAGQRLRIRRS